MDNTDFIQHTTNWVNGEIVEATIMSIVGGIIVIGSLLFWKLGTTPYAKAMFIPLLVVGLIPLVNGIFNVQNNKKRLVEYEQAWQANEQEFLRSEQARVKGFDEIFKYTYPFALVLTIGGAAAFFLVGNSANWKAITLAMLTLGLMTYFIDHFAKERGDMYLQQIEERLG